MHLKKIITKCIYCFIATGIGGFLGYFYGIELPKQEIDSLKPEIEDYESEIKYLNEEINKKEIELEKEQKKEQELDKLMSKVEPYTKLTEDEKELVQKEVEEREELERQRENKANAKYINYKQLEKNSKRYLGTYAKFRGRIMQIVEDEDESENFIILSTGSGGYGDNIYVTYEGLTDFVEDDYVTCYGYIGSDYSYESVAGYNLTIPSLEADIIE